MTDLKQRVTRFGDPFYKFYLSDGKQAIRVISLGSPSCQSGAVTVKGTFAKIKRGRLSVSYNVVSASRVICRQEKSRDEPGAERDPAGGVRGAEEGTGGVNLLADLTRRLPALVTAKSLNAAGLLRDQLWMARAGAGAADCRSYRRSRRGAAALRWPGSGGRRAGALRTIPLISPEGRRGRGGSLRPYPRQASGPTGQRSCARSSSRPPTSGR
jgi:hypothetical protein